MGHECLPGDRRSPVGQLCAVRESLWVRNLRRESYGSRRVTLYPCDCWPRLLAVNETGGSLCSEEILGCLGGFVFDAGLEMTWSFRAPPSRDTLGHGGSGRGTGRMRTTRKRRTPTRKVMLGEQEQGKTNREGVGPIWRSWLTIAELTPLCTSGAEKVDRPYRPLAPIRGSEDRGKVRRGTLTHQGVDLFDHRVGAGLREIVAV